MSFADEIEGALTAIDIVSSTSFTWAGQAACPDRHDLKGAAALEYLREHLEARLYESYYCTGTVSPLPYGQRTAWTGDPILIGQLSTANSGTGCWATGWLPCGHDAGAVLVKHGGVTFRAPPVDVSGKPRGETVSVRVPKEQRNSSPGFYMALCNRPIATGAETVRLYWNLRNHGAQPFVAAATSLLNEAGMPAWLKVANSAAGLARRDAAVVYVPRYLLVGDDKSDAADTEHPGAVAGVFGAIYDAMAPYLNDGVPALTRRVAHGLGLAEDPMNGRSFGQDRCRLITSGVLSAFRSGDHKDPGRVFAAVEDAFKYSGVDIHHPYLRTRPEPSESHPLIAWAPLA